MRVSIASIGLYLITTLTGCATVVHGTNQVIPVASTPEGARVSIDGNPVGVTPLSLTVSRKQSHLVSISHDSFPSVDIVLSTLSVRYFLAPIR